MKVRLFHDSIRLRLSRDEVETLARGERLENSTRFSPENALLWILSGTADLRAPQARFEESQIIVLVPVGAAKRLCDEDQLAIRHQQPTGPDSFLSILIEKDFECLDAGKNEPGVKFFPNPRKIAAV